MDNLAKLRKEIDKTDLAIYKLITKRAELAKEIGELKKSSGDTNFYKPEREAQILHKIINNNDSLLKNKDIAYIFRQIISSCLALEQPLMIAYLGPVGTWSGDASIKHFGSAVSTSACINLEEVFVKIIKNQANYGVIPIENSNNGTVTATVKLLYQHDLNICGEIEMKIEHQLMTKKNAKIKAIAAHQQTLEQCRKFLSNNYADVTLKAVESNALAAKMANDDNTTAAIASKNAAQIYNLNIIHANIEDDIDNSTRFLVIGKERVKKSGNDKTTILVSAVDRAGMLFDILNYFKSYNINLLKLDSYPDPNFSKWRYLFLMDFAGHIDDKHITKMLTELKNLAEIKILGSYPKSIF